MSSVDTGRKFHFIREIASGGFGTVFLAKVIHNDGFSRLVAIKLLHARWSDNDEVASRMRDEARLLGWLRHKNIVDVLDLTIIDGRAAVIMEYLEAVDMKVVVSSCRRRKQRAPLRSCLSVAAAVASVLDAAYNRPPYAGEKPLRVIHRDIKPSNIMVDAGGSIKVLDFGVARAEFAAREAKTKEIAFGSLEYMSPERLFFEPESPASDVYSLGATLFEFLALEKLGKAALRDDEHERFVNERIEGLLDGFPAPPEVLEQIIVLIKEMLAFEEEDRPPAAECSARLRALSRRCDDEPIDEWAERALPELVLASQNRNTKAEPDPLVGKIVQEDRPLAEPVDDGTEAVAGALKRETLGLAEKGAEESHGRQDDDKWHKLKAATLAEISDIKPPKSTANAPTQRRVQRRGPPARASVSSPGRPAVKVPVQRKNSSERGLWVAALMVSFVAFVVLLALTTFAVSWAIDGSAPRQPNLALPGSAQPEPTSPAPVVFPPSGGAAAPETAPPSAPVANVVPVPPPVPDDSATFVSLLENTKRITVRCGAVSGQGDERAIVSGNGLGDCTVTAVDRRRKRMTATVQDVEHREYACFRNSETTCE